MMRLFTNGVFASLSLLLLVAQAAPARAVEVRLEVAPVVSVPLTPLLDGLPVSLEATVDSPRTVYLTELTQSTGGGVSVALLLNDWEIRYELASVDFDRVRLTHVMYPDDMSLFFLATGDWFEGGVPSADVSSEFEAILVHSVALGYRFTPYEWVVHPYFPLAVGFTAAQIGNGVETMLGFNLQLGGGLQWDVTDAFRVGVGLRYVFSAYANPDTSFGAIQELGIQSAQANQSLFEAVIETWHSLSLNFHASYAF